MYQILLQAAAPAKGFDFGQIGMLLIIVVIFYFFMIRPQQKKAKDQKNFLSELKVGSNVVTIGGIHGKIASIEGEIIYLDVDRGLKLKIDKSSISLDSTIKVYGGAGNTK